MEHLTRLILTSVRWSLLALSLTNARAAPKSDEPGAFAPDVTDRWYLSTCGVVVAGNSEREVIDQCARELKRERMSAKKCDCRKHGDIVHLTPTLRPKFYIAGHLHNAASPDAASAKCFAELREEQKRSHSRQTLASWQCDHVEAIYGPYHRKPYADDMDDSRIYNYFSSDGFWLDKDGVAPCFAANTPVALPDGTTKPIEQVVPGDLVLSWSVDEHRLVAARVVRTKARTAKSVLTVRLADRRVLQVTPNHPLSSPSRGDWVAAGDLAVGDTVDVLSGDTILPLAITAIDGRDAVGVSAGAPVPVWDLTIVGTHAFFAAGVLAHNY